MYASAEIMIASGMGLSNTIFKTIIRLQHAVDLFKVLFFIRRKVDDAVGDKDIDRRISDGQVLYIYKTYPEKP